MIHTDKRTEEDKYYNGGYVHEAYQTLARYMIVQGSTPVKINTRTLYSFYSSLLEVQIAKSKRTKWLCQIARVLERNQHKEFTLSPGSIRFVL